MKLLFASQNAHKRDEMAYLFVPHTIIMPHEVSIVFHHEETADTFWGNALGKAENLFRLTGKPVIADDSGLMVDALGGAPGILSARYGADIFGKNLDSDEKNRFLLDNLSGIPKHERSARFVCAIALVLDANRRFLVQETVEGYIAMEPYGKGGFGYDPIFMVEETGRTMASLTEAEKNLVSHRGRAARRMLAIIATLEQEETFHVC